MEVIQREFIEKHLPRIREDAHKTSRGCLLVIAGSYGMAGACLFAAKAALYTGAGYVTVLAPDSIYPILATTLPGAVYLPYQEEDADSFQRQLEKGLGRADAVLSGCGLGSLRTRIQDQVSSLVTKPLLVDADGLNAISESGRIPVSEDRVFTPHAGEMGRLLRLSPQEVQKDREKALEMGLDLLGGTLLLKGPATLVGDRDTESGLLRITENPTGTRALSRAGSGDVLSGIIGALMAQGVPGPEAARMGAYIHGLAGQEAARKKGVRSCLPEDFIEALPAVFKSLSPEDFA